MYRATLTLFLLSLASLAGCVHPNPIGPTASSPNAPVVVVRTTPVALAPVEEIDDGFAFYDMAEAYGLKVSIDLVTGRRVCVDAANTVAVMPSREDLTINGVRYPLSRMIYWKKGVLYLPGESRAILAEHMRIAPVPQVAQVSERFDGSAYDWKARKAKPAVAKRTARAVALPSAWRVKTNRRWNHIVIHHSATAAGGAKSFHRSHAKKWKNGLGYHFVIGNGTNTSNGEVEVGTRWLRQGQGIDGAHAGNKKYNKFGIGICLVGDFNSGGRPSAKQLAQLRTLCRALMKRYGIPAKNIVPHGQVRKGHTDCPGKSFPLRSFIRSL
jgi:hypothetical protein